MKKNIRKIPDVVRHKIETLGDNDFVVFATKKISKTEILEGKWQHLGIKYNQDKLTYPNSIIPSHNNGKYSKMNVLGVKVKRKDLPKETHYNVIDSPNWGDYENGSHFVFLPYEKYPIDFQGPKEISINIKCLKFDAESNYNIFTFTSNQIFNKKNSDYLKEVFFVLNIMQENVGYLDIMDSNTSYDDYVKTLIVEWEILPPGTKDEVIKKIFKNHTPSKKEINVAEDRYNFFSNLNPTNFIYGTNGLNRYFGIKISDDIVLFENMKNNNALYIFYDNWQELSQRTRIELISGRFGVNFDRIVHSGDWKKKVKSIIERKLMDKNNKG